MTPDHIRERMLAAARTSNAPTRAQLRARMFVWLLSALASMVVVLSVYGGVRPYHRPTVLLVGTALGALAAALAASWLAVGRGSSMLGRRSGLLLIMAAALPLALFAWKVGFSAAFEGMLAAWPERIGLRCLGLSLASGLAPLTAFLAVRRGSDPLKPGLTGVALGAAAGACAWVAVDLWCPVAHPRHLMLGHFLPVLLFMIAGGFSGRYLLLPRRG